MKLKNLSILQKVSLVVVLMGIASLAITFAGAHGLHSLGNP